MSIPEAVAPVRIGIAGLGRAGMFHVERIGLREDLKVVALFDDCRTARERARVESATMHATWDAFLGDPATEAVLLATPPASHAELAIAALAAGKDVLVETPLGLSVAEVDTVVSAARRTGRSVSVAQTRRWNDDFRTALGVLQSGSIGRPRAIKFVNWQYAPQACNGRSRKIRTGQLPAEPDDNADHWRSHPATGGGAVWEFGVHHFDQLLQLAGLPLESVYAQLSFDESSGPAENGFLAAVSFVGGLTAHIEVNRTAAAPLSTGWMIAGDAGSYAGFTQFQPTSDGEVVDLPLAPTAGHAVEFYRGFARHLRYGEPNPVTAEAARSTIALIEAVRTSAKRGEVVHF